MRKTWLSPVFLLILNLLNVPFHIQASYIMETGQPITQTSEFMDAQGKSRQLTRTGNRLVGNDKRQLDDCPDWPAELQIWRSQNAASLNQQKNNKGKVMPYTLEALQTIWRHQHPADCSKAMFLIFKHWVSGIGSSIHLQSMYLRAALDSGRILVEEPGHFLTDTPYCGSNRTLGTCYLHPLTNCTLTDEQAATAMVVSGKEEFTRMYAKDPSLPQFLKFPPQNGAILRHIHAWPNVFQAMLNNSVMIPGASYARTDYLFWWRAVGAAYFLRPNERTYTELLKRRRAKLLGSKLRPGCITLYVRHGDKIIEMPVFSDSEYENAVLNLTRINPSLTRQIFLSTEDPATVTFFMNAERNWTMSYVDMPRKPDPKILMVAYMRKHGFHEEFLDGLLNLELSMECDGFVGTGSSNWSW